MTQLYSTPDGSIWEASAHEPGCFNRVAGKGYEDDFRAQKLDEVLRSWGPLSLHDPIAAQIDALTAALESVTWFGCKSFILTGGGPKLLVGVLNKLGYEIAKKGRQ